MNVGDECGTYLTAEDVREAFERLEDTWEEVKAAFDKICESYVDSFKELQELCEGCTYEESSAKIYGQNLRIHKNDIYKCKSRPQKVQRVYRRWHNDYTYRFA
jgi:hypothetical protein